MFVYYDWQDVNINWESVDMVWELVGFYTTPTLKESALMTSMVQVKRKGISEDFVATAQKAQELLPIALIAESILPKKDLLLKTNVRYNKNLFLEKSFFKTPDKIKLLKNAAALTLTTIINQNLTSKFTGSIRDDIRAKTILEFSTQDLDESYLSKLLLECYNEDLNPMTIEIAESDNVYDIVNKLGNINDIDSTVKQKRIQRLDNLITSNIAKYNKLQRKWNNAQGVDFLLAAGLIGYSEVKNFNAREAFRQEKQALDNIINSYRLLLDHVSKMSKDLLSKTDKLSAYRTKYIQKIIRNTYALISEEIKGFEKEASGAFTKILNALKQIDTLLIAITLLTTLYVTNRRLLRKRSQQSLNSISAALACLPDTPEPFDVSVVSVPFTINLECPVSSDDVIVPHVPIELKLEQISCEINQNVEIDVKVESKTEITKYAIIRNDRKDDKLTISLDKDSDVSPEVRIGTLGKLALYSPVIGTIDSISENELILTDITDPEEDELSKQINILGSKYNRMNELKDFIKKYYILSLYPVMLATSSEDDKKTLDKYINVEKHWKDALKDLEKLDKEYEKQVKKISGKDNVKKQAENETLYKIKEELEQFEKINFDKQKLIAKKAINISKATKPKNDEFELFEYYILELGAKLNGLENLTGIEIKFRDEIQEIIRKRFIVDKYNKSKLENKINDQIKEIEKGLTIGNWFKKAKDIYDSSKSLETLKKWLLGLANDNKKLTEHEKIVYVNRTMFLFSLYLSYDRLVKHYNILKKETTPKKETIKEGNFISQFFNAAWKELDQLPKEIEKIESFIDSLSLFQTYTVIDYQGYSARLYSLTDKTTCESEEKDPYITGKSTYGYGDIQYWLKYCSFATLASVSNPITGWSTGWIFPAPIPFPVIYIPLKSIMTKFGFIVVGISICGIYVFPWTLFSNLTNEYNTPLGNPTAFIKKEIDALKREVAEQIKNLRKSFIKNAMEDTKKKIRQIELKIKDTQRQLEDHKNNKPEKYESSEGSNLMQGVRKNITYVSELKVWTQTKFEFEENIVILKTQKWGHEKVYAILDSASRLGTSLKGSQDKLEQAEKLINGKLDAITGLLDKANKLLAPLPITMQPNTTNFGLTLKNLKPIIRIEEDLDDNINETPLNTLIDKFKLKNDDFISKTFSNKIDKSVINYKLYTSALSLNMVTIMKRDAFPSYELLKLTNVPWVSFLYKNFVTEGAKTFGFPGQPPLPL